MQNRRQYSCYILLATRSEAVKERKKPERRSKQSRVQVRNWISRISHLASLTLSRAHDTTTAERWVSCTVIYIRAIPIRALGIYKQIRVSSITTSGRHCPPWGGFPLFGSETSTTTSTKDYTIVSKERKRERTSIIMRRVFLSLVAAARVLYIYIWMESPVSPCIMAARERERKKEFLCMLYVLSSHRIARLFIVADYMGYLRRLGAKRPRSRVEISIMFARWTCRASLIVLQLLLRYFSYTVVTIDALARWSLLYAYEFFFAIIKKHIRWLLCAIEVEFLHRLQL